MNRDINYDMAFRQGLTDDDIDDLEYVYGLLLYILEQPDNFTKLPSTVSDWIESMEFNLQKIWKFDQNKDYHRYWYVVKYCTCPKLDNKDLIGTKYFIINESCPYHGSNPATDWNDERFKNDAN